MEIRFRKELAPIWRDIAQLLAFGYNEIQGIEKPGSGKTFEACLDDVIGRWMANAPNMSNAGRYPANWRGFHNLLEDAERGVLAGNLRAAIEAGRSDIHKNFDDGKHYSKFINVASPMFQGSRIKLYNCTFLAASLSRKRKLCNSYLDFEAFPALHVYI